MMLYKQYLCPTTNDVILVTNSKCYGPKFMKEASYHLAFPSVKIHDISQSQYDDVIKNCKTVTAKTV